MKLSNKNIDAAMLDIEKFFDESGVAQKDKLQLCLVLEESLLRWQEKLGDSENFNFEVYTKNWLNSPKVNSGIVAVITLLLNHFGFSLDAIGLIMVADAVVVNASSVFGMLVRDCELYDVSHEINFEGKSA